MLRYICIFTALLCAPAAHAAPIYSNEGESAEIIDLFEVDSVEVRALPDIGGVSLLVNNECGDASVMSTPLDGITWEDIVNIGQQVWKIIEDNKPVLHAELPVAHAMPKGLKCWSDLERWNAPRTQSYEVLYKNKFGMEVVKFRFRLQFTFGGTRVGGTGRYIANATVAAGQIDVMWAYTFNANLEVARAVNLGTSADPIAGLEMNLHWNVKTWVKESENSVHFFITGNGDVNFAE